MARLTIVGMALLALLAWVLGNGGARIDAQPRDQLVARGRALFTEKGCYGCHTIGAAGTPIGPDLRRSGGRQSEATLAHWLRDPSAQEATRHMPNLGLSEAEANALAAYLVSLQ